MQATMKMGAHDNLKYFSGLIGKPSYQQNRQFTKVVIEIGDQKFQT